MTSCMLRKSLKEDSLMMAENVSRYKQEYTEITYVIDVQ
jgi:hypothetical protein